MTAKRALAWSGFWAGAALAFFVFLRIRSGGEPAVQFLSGYLVELSLSVDNVLVFAVIFEYFRIEPGRQRRLLSWGILGSAVLRAVFIVVGAGALHRYHWLLDVFAAFLLFAAFRLLRSHGPGRLIDPEKNPGVRLIELFVRPASRIAARFLFVLLVVETTDLIFALDSLPAVLAVAPDPRIAFISNLFAVIGLRSLYFAVVGMRRKLRYLESGLALILAFIAARILAARWVEISTGASLAVVGAVLAGVAAANLRRRR